MTTLIIRVSTTRLNATLLVFLLAINFAEPSVAQDDDTIGPMAVGLIIGAGSEYLPNDDNNNGITWQTLTVAPDISFGKFRLGLAAKLRFRFDGDAAGEVIDIRDEDWVPAPTVPGRSFFDLFLPIVRYAHYGMDGEPLIIRLGSFDNATLGTGFIVGEYSNTQLLPQRRLFGIDLDLDGAAFDLPIIGIESLVGSLSARDVIAARVWSRPLYGLALPVISFLQLGATAAADFDPFRYHSDTVDAVSVSALGVDLIVPIVTTTGFSFSTHGDLVFLGTSEGIERSFGTMVGVSGRVSDTIHYGLQVRVTDDRFIPVYFDVNYDLLRPVKYQTLREAEQSAMHDGTSNLSRVGWAAHVDISLLERHVDLALSLSGPLTSERDLDSNIPYAPLDSLQIRGSVGIRDVLIPGISFDLNYEKRKLDRAADLIAPEDLVIATGLSFKAGNTVISASYRGHYDSAVGGLTGSPVLASWIKLI